MHTNFKNNFQNQQVLEKLTERGLPVEELFQETPAPVVSPISDSVKIVEEAVSFFF